MGSGANPFPLSLNGWGTGLGGKGSLSLRRGAGRSGKGSLSLNGWAAG
ncbi:hypothetical protein X928_05260 [Petrotoga miotherma DSM 10691]|uniref:Uncharacterized protein n=1 Tax=Petrotoga miotherma DSM 10691 TaxID=1434326 RepID=A0A2K1PC20_9BACT|nr:hypothetical protein X928_05260 [Petrotoga miotherma DSM 10691]